MSKLFEVSLYLLLLSIGQFANAKYTTIDKSGCVFPFKYKEKTYDDCIQLEKNFPWCSLSENFRGAWKYCHDMTKTDLVCKTECNNDEFPFCRTTNNKKAYCLDQILDLSKEPIGSCDLKYKKISPIHTACLPAVKYVARSGVTDREKEMIVELHNKWRRSATPKAAAMQKMYWDDELANLAQKHANRCSFAHDDMNLRSIPGTGKETGQNIVMVTDSRKYNFTYSFDEMYAGEQKRWEYGTGIKAEHSGRHALHYTQIMLEQISRLGCGFAECVYADRLERVFVCNYNYMQTFDETIKPYTKGKSCENCPNTCDNNLCDCKGKECYNSGRLDVNTCKCACHGHWTGEDCTTGIKVVKDDLGCAFPFYFENKLHYECITESNGDEWCSTSKIYGEDFDEEEGPAKFCNEAKKKRSSSHRENKVVSLNDLNENFVINGEMSDFEDFEKREDSDESFSFGSLAKKISDLIQRSRKATRKFKHLPLKKLLEE